jgi:pyridoxamine 5'-phosphate oxidase
MNPLQLFNSDRDRARAQEDAMAHLCTVANVDANGQAQVRTLVLREIAGQLAIFVNATSPKWAHLQNGFVLHTYWPSVQVQYRMQVSSAPLDNKTVHDSWHMRPDMPKRMDWFYEQQRVQSSPIDSREALLEQINTVQLPDPLHAPDNARGLLIQPFEIERLDLTQPEGVHDRTRFLLAKDEWQVLTLVP